MGLSIEVLFVLCRPPVDPVKLVLTYLEQVERTKVTKLRYDSPYSICTVNDIPCSYVQRVFPIQLVYAAGLDLVASQTKKLFAELTDPTTVRAFLGMLVSPTYEF